MAASRPAAVTATLGVAGAVVAGRREVGLERVAQVGEHDAVLRPARAGHAGHDRGQVQLEGLVELRRGAGIAPQALLLGVGLDEGHAIVAAGQAQVGQRLVVDGEDAGGGAVLGRHVGDRGAVGQGQRGQPVAVELHELADHAVRCAAAG